MPRVNYAALTHTECIQLLIIHHEARYNPNYSSTERLRADECVRAIQLMFKMRLTIVAISDYSKWRRFSDGVAMILRLWNWQMRHNWATMIGPAIMTGDLPFSSVRQRFESAIFSMATRTSRPTMDPGLSIVTFSSCNRHRYALLRLLVRKGLI